jgi:2-hydroxy-3-keto-5-methylthiopentenyl-1-phosphate phosphatase
VATLVSDFDGTLTRHDFFRLAVERLMPPGVPDYWQEYRAGRMTHFEAMRAYFASIRATEAETLGVVEALGLERDLAGWVKQLADSEWKLIIASAGCDWYIQWTNWRLPTLFFTVASFIGNRIGELCSLRSAQPTK